jgi:hypothetical protein
MALLVNIAKSICLCQDLRGKIVSQNFTQKESEAIFAKTEMFGTIFAKNHISFSLKCKNLIKLN